jgi:hypothetical protein
MFYRLFGLVLFEPEDEGIAMLQKAVNCLQIDTKWHPNDLYLQHSL